VASCPALAWLEAHPTSLRLSDGAFCASLLGRVGDSKLPLGTLDATCFFCAPLSSTETELALVCHYQNVPHVLRCNEAMEIVGSALCQAGATSVCEPNLSALHAHRPRQPDNHRRRLCHRPAPSPPAARPPTSAHVSPPSTLEPQASTGPASSPMMSRFSTFLHCIQ
jgi:hypothetical protein